MSSPLFFDAAFYVRRTLRPTPGAIISWTSAAYSTHVDGDVVPLHEARAKAQATSVDQIRFIQLHRIEGLPD